MVYSASLAFAAIVDSVHFKALVVFLLLCWQLLRQVDFTTITLAIMIPSCSSFAFSWRVVSLHFTDNHPILIQSLGFKLELLLEFFPEYSRPSPMTHDLLIALVSP
jgi:hypothetical protein